ncbi:nucleoside-diphosphate sugar epimerase [Legionella lansingensis]|uniref:Nucleoside-diphosphate sugar epimerase n=1 Tax=Legionella lansingensis TaxID=45067 RepID=A0A0W0VTP3_9GAMM|nr:TIGR01777 family oxidoreductase [Legionella lansingensis]KTD23620.1 nucleoside-diphosphate sugar epimerase [Legionella lansingensis]SNV52433.1 nucleoside-diphosphate sugar epimerase [Legionella lansingensis]
MKLLIAGASGFIGTELVNLLLPKHDIIVVGRSQQKLQHHFSNKVRQSTWENLSTLDAKNYDAVINLCGHNIAAFRWTEKVKKLIIDSRVETTHQLINWATSQQAKPHFYCANAVGIYGVQNDNDTDVLDEDTAIDFEHPRDFLSEIGIRWQQALNPAFDHGMRVTITRFGVVLKKNQGMLKRLAPSFYLGLGSILGNGKQIISWVHIQDVIRAIEFLLNHPELTGVFNVTAPHPVSQEEFARTLAKAMHRPLWLRTPAFIVRSLFGEMGEYLLLKGQRVISKRLPEVGYQFLSPELRLALEKEFGAKA